MKKNGKSPKNVKKETKKEVEPQTQVTGEQVDGKEVFKEAENGKVPKASKPKAPKSKLWNWKFPQNIESFIRKNTEKGKSPKDLIPTVVKMFEEVRPLEEKASKKRAMRAIWQVRHDMGVTKKSK